MVSPKDLISLGKLRRPNTSVKGEEDFLKTFMKTTFIMLIHLRVKCFIGLLLARKNEKLFQNASVSSGSMSDDFIT